MKIAVVGIADVVLGKQNVKDARLDQADKLVKAKKKTYVQVELTGEDGLLDADAIITLSDTRMDLVLRDLEFVETRLGRNPQEPEKALLNKIKSALEEEKFISTLGLSPDEQKLIAGATFLTNKPIVVVTKDELADMGVLLVRVLKESNYISFLTVGDKENRAWLIPKGTTAWEAAGVIHSDIQKGFIRGEVISFNDFIQAAGEAQAKQAGKMHLEQKEYIMQDCDLVNFRFNK